MRGDLLRQGAHGGLQQAFISFTERQDFLVSRLWEQKERFILQCLEVPCVKEDNAWSFSTRLAHLKLLALGPPTGYRDVARGLAWRPATGLRPLAAATDFPRISVLQDCVKITSKISLVNELLGVTIKKTRL